MRRRSFIGMLAGAMFAAKAEVFGVEEVVREGPGKKLGIEDYLRMEAERITEEMRLKVKETWEGRYRKAYEGSYEWRRYEGGAVGSFGGVVVGFGGEKRVDERAGERRG